MRLKFGDCIFDADTREVVRAGQPSAISPKAFALLELLIASRPAAVSKADIRSRLWPDVHVSESNLANLVVELRAALGDDARRPRILRTVSRFGYAFRATARPERRVAEHVLGTRDLVYRLVWNRREIALEPGENLIGRDSEAVVWIDDESVSRRHARIGIGREGATIEDLGSKNGTYLAGKKIRGAVVLSDRDVLTIGPAKLTVRVLKRTGSTRSTRSKGPK
jgi:DNA-binding winged helix-turn-helix (wHTH) protein